MNHRTPEPFDFKAHLARVRDDSFSLSPRQTLRRHLGLTRVVYPQRSTSRPYASRWIFPDRGSLIRVRPGSNADTLDIRLINSYTDEAVFALHVSLDSSSWSTPQYPDQLQFPFPRQRLQDAQGAPVLGLYLLLCEARACDKLIGIHDVPLYYGYPFTIHP